MKHKYLLVLLLLTFSSFAAENDFQGFLDAWRVKHQVTSVIVSVQNKAGQITDTVSGPVKLNSSRLVSSNNLYGVGSITKTFLSATLLQLQSEHKLCLDDSLGSYFPEYPKWKKLTIRQLLNSTSGIYNYTDSSFFKELCASDTKNIISPRKFIDIAYNEPSYFAPGKGWHYSNTNYILLGLLIEKLTHQSLGKVLKQRFLKPLNLKNTFYAEGLYPTYVQRRMAHGYYKGQDRSHFNASTIGVGAAGAMIMNSHDLIAWAHALFTPGIILTKKNIKELQAHAADGYSKAPFPVSSHFGLAVLSLRDPKLGTIWFYTGVIEGYTSLFVWIPSQQKIIAVQAASWPATDYKILFPDQELIQSLL